MINKKFGKLTVLDLHHVKQYSYYSRKFYTCLCICGNIKIIQDTNLYSGHSKSCGCYRREILSNRMKTHGISKSRIYKIWGGMHYRCRSGQRLYKNIQVCKEWKSFELFYQDMAFEYDRHVKKYGSKNTTIDRIDSKGNYSKSNCRWATYKVQGSNTSTSVYLEYKGKTKLFTQWIKDFGLNRSTVYYRLARGLNRKQALGLE